MKLVDIFLVDSIRVYGYSIKGHSGVWRSMTYYPDTWRIPMIKDVWFD